MPGFDRTGPEGKGPMTGRKQGKCKDTSTDQEQEKGEERGGSWFGFRRRQRRRNRNQQGGRF